MSELSIFIDESGDFGEYDKIAPYYIVALVIHHQEEDISSQLRQLENSLAEAGFPQHCIHAGPIIRRENESRLHPYWQVLHSKRLAALSFLSYAQPVSQLQLSCY